MSVFVFYKDDYAENGGVGLEELKSVEEATTFINQRLSQTDNPDITNYTVIEGRLLTLDVVNVVREVAIRRT